MTTLARVTEGQDGEVGEMLGVVRRVVEIVGPIAVNAAGAATYLGISKRQFTTYVNAGTFHPGYKLGRRRLWDLERLRDEFRRLPVAEDC